MSELDPVDVSILDLLRSHRDLIKAERAEDARLYAELLKREEHQLSTESLLAQEVIALGDAMLQEQKRRQGMQKKALTRNAGRLVLADPSKRLKKKQAIRILEKVEGHIPHTIRSEAVAVAEPDGITGEEIRQSWFVESDVRPMPSSDYETRRARISVYSMVSTSAITNPASIVMYTLHARETTDGVYEGEWREGETQLEGDDLFVPLGFVLAAKKQYV